MPSQPRNDGAVRERERSFPVSFDRYIVAEFGAQIVVAAAYVAHGDQLPVAVPGGDLDAIDRGGLSIRLSMQRVLLLRRARPAARHGDHQRDDRRQPA